MPGKLAERRRKSDRQLAELDQRSWQLTALSLAISLLLALAIGVFFYPSLRWGVNRIEAHLAVLPQLVLGLLTLVFLTSVYIVTKQRELAELRGFIISTYAETAISREKYPADALTGVLDRSSLPDILKRETARADRYDIPLCLALFDIRAFRKVNEREGNLGGDQILKELARAILKTARQTDIVARYGPDQFLCFLPGTELQGGEAFTRRIVTASQQSSRCRALTLDFGLAVYRTQMDAERVLTDAEKDLEAKRAPKEAASAISKQPSGSC